jgi:hypothetical protein
MTVLENNKKKERLQDFRKQKEFFEFEKATGQLKTYELKIHGRFPRLRFPLSSP